MKKRSLARYCEALSDLPLPKQQEFDEAAILAIPEASRKEAIQRNLKEPREAIALSYRPKCCRFLLWDGFRIIRSEFSTLPDLTKWLLKRAMPTSLYWGQDVDSYPAANEESNFSVRPRMQEFCDKDRGDDLVQLVYLSDGRPATALPGFQEGRCRAKLLPYILSQNPDLTTQASYSKTFSSMNHAADKARDTCAASREAQGSSDYVTGQEALPRSRRSRREISAIAKEKGVSERPTQTRGVIKAKIKQDLVDHNPKEAKATTGELSAPCPMGIGQGNRHTTRSDQRGAETKAVRMTHQPVASASNDANGAPLVKEGFLSASAVTQFRARTDSRRNAANSFVRMSPGGNDNVETASGPSATGPEPTHGVDSVEKDIPQPNSMHSAAIAEASKPIKDDSSLQSPTIAGSGTTKSTASIASREKDLKPKSHDSPRKPSRVRSEASTGKDGEIAVSANDSKRVHQFDSDISVTPETVAVAEGQIEDTLVKAAVGDLDIQRNLADRVVSLSSSFIEDRSKAKQADTNGAQPGGTQDRKASVPSTEAILAPSEATTTSSGKPSPLRPATASASKSRSSSFSEKLPPIDMSDILTAADSALVAVDLCDVLSLKTWMEELEPAERAALYGLLPEVDRRDPAVLLKLFQSNMAFKSSLSHYRRLLAKGTYDPSSISKERNKRRRAEGWNQEKEEQLEEFYAFRLDPSSANASDILRWKALDQGVVELYLGSIGSAPAPVARTLS
jgi:hypothetical protein